MIISDRDLTKEIGYILIIELSGKIESNLSPIPPNPQTETTTGMLDGYLVDGNNQVNSVEDPLIPA
jgi:hypothetical protein